MEETNTTPTSSLHSQWPGAFGIIRPAREAMKRIWKTMLVFIVITILAGIMLQMGRRITSYNWSSLTYASLTQLISFAVSALISCAEIVTVLASLRGKQIGYSSAFKLGFPMWWRMILLNILVGLSVLGGLVLLIVPGIWIALRLSLATYYLVDRDMGVMDAYKASWHDTKGELGKLWGIIGVLLLMVAPSFTIIGVLATVYLLFMYWPAAAMLYMYVSSRPQAKNPSSAAQGAA